MSIYRGDVFWWNCPEHDRPHLLNKVRPVVVLSNDICNMNSAVITVAPLTSKVRKPYPTQVPVVLNDGVSIVLVDKVTAIPVEELGDKMCHLKQWQMAQIDQALRIQFALDEHPEDEYLSMYRGFGISDLCRVRHGEEL